MDDSMDNMDGMDNSIWIMMYNIMQIVQQLYQRVQQIYLHKYPPPPPLFPNLPQPTTPAQPYYPNVLQSIQSQLQKRIINVGKIKAIGEELYDQLTADIATMCDNHQVLLHAGQIQHMVDQCGTRFVAMVDDVVAKYLGTKIGDGDGFHGFVVKDYHQFSSSVDRQILNTYKQVTQQLSKITIPIKVHPQQQPPSIWYPQHFQTVVQIIKKFRSVLASEYQQLLSTRSNKQQQCRSAVIFLSKLRTLFVEMEHVLWSSNCALNCVYHYAEQLKHRIYAKLVTNYQMYIRAPTQQYHATISSMFRFGGNGKVDGGEGGQQGEGQQINRKKLSYEPSTKWQSMGWYYLCHIQILQYLYLKSCSQRELTTVEQSMSKCLQSLSSSITKPQSIQSTMKHIQNQIKRLKLIVNVGTYTYFQEIEDLAHQFLIRVDFKAREWQAVQIFINQHAITCAGLIGRLKDIAAMNKQLPYKQSCDVCMELYHISQQLKHIILQIQQNEQLNSLQLKHTLISQTSVCRQLRQVFQKPHKPQPQPQLNHKQHQQPIQKPEQISKRIQSVPVSQHILIEQHPVQDDGQRVTTEEEVGRLMDYVDRSTEFYQFELKDLVGGGFDLIVYHLQKSNNTPHNTKILKLTQSINTLLKQSQTMSTTMPTQNTSNNLQQLIKQCQVTTLNTKILQFLVSMSYTSASGRSIMRTYEQCVNFQYQDWHTKIREFQMELKLFHAKCKDVYQLQHNNTTSMFSVVYRILKQYISILEVIYDIFQQTLYVFSHCKKLETNRKGSIHSKPINILSDQDLTYLMEVLSCKLKMNDEIAQLDKFNNIPKPARAYLKAIYAKFNSNYNAYLPYQQDTLNNLIQRIQSAIGFVKGHQEIFTIYQATLQRITTPTADRKQIEEIGEMSRQIKELANENKQIEKLADIRLPIDMKSLEQFRKIAKSHIEYFKFAQFVTQLIQTNGKQRGNAADMDRKSQNLYLKLIEAYKSFYG